ncbi:DUF455 family protein [Luteolibacter yonseiensis]|uniref:DUF455 family protein n=1 Tax=Luteolibacter yonseiensis TaxID=1144680 RepID=A0A934VA82_9BACT|nr:DUF455 family protein [Luteolibacter yonseiensis]MBK1814880.1 DUF455 family protein [Luteolibacter yonseiensis]
MTEIREIAERVLFAETLEEKLRLGPVGAVDHSPGPAIALPDAPGRPRELRVRGNGVRVDFPGIHRLDDDRERGVMLHFLANHELLAAELMALVLLRFPDAPKEYRAGVYEAMREEQAHALMYVRRMKECGIAFGELPVNDHFWRLIAPMETPLDFVTRLNLTFEQANLDFSKHYAGLFRQVGDTATAAVLEKIHQDEIGHVGHGLKWFRRWKEGGETDWQAFRRCLHFPLTPARAKGLAPFNADSRRLAGLDEDFISHLEVCEHSRGRTPVVHWFNPNAESHARATMIGKPWQPDKTALALEHDLEALMLGCCRRDDAVLMRAAPSIDHLTSLKNAGYELPEIMTVGSPAGRKLGGLRPWAWSPDAVERLRPYADDVSPNVDQPWREALPAEWFSKEIGLRLEHAMGPVPETGLLFHEVEPVLSAIQRHLGSGQALLKAPMSYAGRGHLRVNAESDPLKTRNWISNTLASHGSVVVEPWLDRVMDFSALYEMKADGAVPLIGMTRMENDAAGRFLGIRVSPKWGTILDPEIAVYLFREARVMEVYQKQIPALLGGLLPGYVGPLCVDAMVHRRADGSPALKPVVEMNVRMTMGRIAWEWMKRKPGSAGGRLRLLRRQSLTAAELEELRKGPGIFLNDPASALSFLAFWEER